MAAVELGNAYISVTASTKGLAKDITSALSDIDVSATGESQGSSLASSISSGLSKAKSAIGNAVKSAADTGISLITSHLDDAISRVDTLNQFPKVLESMGESAEDAEAATDKLSSGIKGLPTSLDDIVNSAQQMYFTLGSLDEATDVTLAMNDALITFNASSYEASNAMEMLNKMISSGSWNSQQWISINNAAPGMLDAIAESLLGEEANMSTLLTALQDGTLSTDDFLQGVVRLDQEGSDSMAAFSETAQTASGGIQTSMDNVDIAITRGIGNVIEALDTEAITNFIDGIADAIDNVSGMIVDFLHQCEQTGAIDAFWEALQKLWDIGGQLFGILGDVIGKIIGVEDPANDAKGVMDALNGALDAVSDALDWIDQNLDWLIPVIEGAIAAFIGFKGSLAIQSLIGDVTKALGLAKTATEGAEGATRGLNTAMDANPIMGIISLIIMLVSYIMELWFTNEDFRDAVTEIFGAIGDFIGGIVDGIVWFFTEAIPGAIQTVIEWFASIPENVSNFLGSLWDNICNVFNNIWEFITGIFDNIGTAISDAFWGIVDFIAGIGWDIWNAVSGAFSDAIDFITSLPEQALQWGADIIQGIIDGITGFIDGIADAVCSIGDTIASFLGFSVPEEGPLSNFDTYMPDMMELMEEGIEEGIPAVEDATSEAANGIAESMNQAFAFLVNSTNDAFNGVVEIVSTTMNDLNNDVQDITRQMCDTVINDFGYMDTTVQGDVDEMAEHVKETLSDISNYLDNFDSDVTDWQSGMSAAFNKTATDMHEVTTSTFNDMSMQSNATLMEMSSDIGSTLNDMYEKSCSTLSNLETASDRTFDNIATNAINSVQGMSDVVTGELAATEDAMDNFTDYANKWGNNLGVEIASGIENASNAVKRAVNDIANDVNSVLGFSQPEEGPLSDFDESMPDMIDLMVEGLIENEDLIKQAAEAIGELLFSGLFSEEYGLFKQLGDMVDRLADEAVNWGIELTESLAAGIEKGSAKVLTCMATLIKAIEKTASVDMSSIFSSMSNDSLKLDIVMDNQRRLALANMQPTTTNNYYIDGIEVTGADAEQFGEYLQKYVTMGRY